MATGTGMWSSTSLTCKNSPFLRFGWRVAHCVPHTSCDETFPSLDENTRFWAVRAFNGVAVGPARTVGFTLQGLFNPVVWTQPQKVQGHPHPSFLSCMQRSHIVFSINSSNSTLKRVRFFLTSVFLMAGSFFLGKKKKRERERERKSGKKVNLHPICLDRKASVGVFPWYIYTEESKSLLTFAVFN